MMINKSFSLIVLTLTLIPFDWGITGNLNLTGMQAVASSCKSLGQISSIQNGFVERKPFGGHWKKIVIGTKLCEGDLLKTKSNPGKKVNVKIKCNDPDNRERSISPDQMIGVFNVCSSSLTNSGKFMDEGAF